MTLRSGSREGTLDAIRLNIDGQEVEARLGLTVLEAAQSAGIYIPTLCSDPDLKPYGGCRLCVVEIEKMRGLPTACTTPATDGMVVHTNTPAVNEVRRTTVELLLADHPSECLICDRKERCQPFDICLRNVAVTERCVTCPKNEHCELQEIVDYLGVKELPFRRIAKSIPVDSSNPFFDRDLNKCILCGKCVRVCDEILGVGAIDLIYRGYASKIATFGDKPIMDSNCVSCGECVARCPVAALMPRNAERPTEEVKTTCPYCGVGCQMYLGVKNGRVISVRGDRDNNVNKGRLCVKGRFGIAEFIHHPDRLTTPLVRRNGKLTETTWDEALDLVASRLANYKGDEVAVISSARCPNEENYLMQKFARVVLGTNNVDNCARLCHAPTVGGLAQSFGSGAMTNSINEIGNATCLLVIGSNTTEAHPVIGMEVNRAVQKGAKLIVVDPREVDTCRYANLWLRLNHGTDIPLLMGMMRIIVDEGLYDSAFIEERCENFDAFRASLKNFDLGSVSRITGVPEKQIVEAVRIYTSNKPSAILYTLGITEHTHGTDNVIAVANLAMLTGNIGKPSSGVNPLRGQNNVQGACDMGCLPNVYPGYQAVTDPASREKFGVAWGCSLPSEPGLFLTEIFDAARQRQVKALYMNGENPALTDPDARHVQETLANLEFLVVQDIFLTETAQFAQVVLPAASFAEKDGTFTNTERRVQRVRKAVEPVGNSKPDWWITCQLGQRMGAKGFDFKRPSEIMEEIARLTPSYGGISYERLEKSGLQWPCPTREHPGTPILHTKQFTRGKGRFIPLEYRPPAELPDSEYPLILSTGRCLYQYHTSMTLKVRGLNILRGEELVQINPKDALALGIADGDMIKVASRRGEVTAKAKVTEVTPAGAIWMTFHFAQSPTNMLTNPALDPAVKIPEYKVCAVRVERV